ncbi:DUF2267 domain-containing protein [Streptomyces sp. PT12]|uniref:DUF2267 domain-containing protein n=1 Tax=Streptomyces sp. PT12 TaxID=1510197 RepID=UPI000DE52141|nr:DUF2267 domain-containing protein [Streptomyces sp. PT12]RBM18696.1 DUF2267 domain-containing protein [Streptomyces sp. PT12]
MSLHPQRTAPAEGLTFDELLERIRHEGAYPTHERTDEVTRMVLAALGRQLPDAERADLAAALPDEAARVLTSDPSAAEPLTGLRFVQALARTTGEDPATVRWDTGSVLTPLAGLVDDALLDRVIAALPSGYALLFGRAELIPAA